MRIPKRLAGLAAVGLSAGLALAACGGDDGGGGDTGDTTTPSWEGCADDPDACNSGDPEAGGEIVWSYEQEQESWNVNTSAGNTLVLSKMVDGLLPSTGKFSPGGNWEWNLDLLAGEAEMTSEDPQTWVYTIAEDAAWSDGTPITADDFVFHWHQLSGDPEHCTDCAPPATAGYESIESIEGSDEGKTVTVTLKEGEKYAEWQYLFTQMYPAHVAAEQGDIDTPDGHKAASDYFSETQPDWSGGPWMVAEADLRQQVILEPNESYYGEGPNLDQLTFRIITEQEALVQAMQNQEINGANPQPNANMVEQIEAMPGTLSYVGAAYQWEHIDLNTTNEWLQDKALRQAIFTAIDVTDINERTFASFFPEISQKTNHLFTEDSEYFQDVITDSGQGAGDAEAALQILTDAGYELDGDTLTLDGEQVGPLRFVHTEGNELRATTAQLVQSYLEEIGVEVTIETTADLGGTLVEGDFDIMIFAWVGSPLFQTSGHQFWHSESPSNFGKYSNPEVDELLDQALNQSDLAEVANLYNQAMPLVVDDAYSLPIADKPSFAFVTADYLNVRPNFTQNGLIYNSQQWGVAPAAQ